MPLCHKSFYISNTSFKTMYKQVNNDGSTDKTRMTTSKV